ncbi:MAG: Rap1a/Tai family immunity protein [Gammaproteobacteria bacterium]
MKKLIIILTASLLFATTLTRAADTADFNASTTRDLVDLCSVSDSDDLYAAAMGYCLGFVDAAHDYHHSITSGELLKPIACPGHDVTRQELVDVFLAWAGANGGLLDSESPIHGLMRAASAKWPCS